MFKFGKGSLEKLNTVHPDLKLLMTEVIKLTPIDFGITEGMRSLERAEQLKADGLSRLELSLCIVKARLLILFATMVVR